MLDSILKKKEKKKKKKTLTSLFIAVSFSPLGDKLKREKKKRIIIFRRFENRNFFSWTPFINRASFLFSFFDFLNFSPWFHYIV